MENFSENNKLFSFGGIINRRNYIVNILLVETIIQAFIATPLMVAVFKSNSLTGSILGGGTMPAWWYVVMCISGILSAIMYMPSVVRRFRDIMGVSGKDNVKSFGIFTFVILILSIPAAFSKDMLLLSFKALGLTILILLACIKGQITTNKPKSEIAGFNWGAFIGTWIWGLFNKSYITLWALPLTFTTGALPFYIVCGLKGNEWAYEKKSDKDIKKFHAGQKVQTIIWTILVPVLSFILVVCGSICLYKFAKSYTKSHPDFAKQAVEHYVRTESQAAMSKFDKIELDENEYKFYINPKKWANSSRKEKMADFDMASGYVMLKNIENGNIAEAFSGTSSGNIMNRIKIYSSYNDELLGEFYLKIEDMEKLMQDAKNNPEIQAKLGEEIKKGYRFNLHPTLP